MNLYPHFLVNHLPHGHCNEEFPMDWRSLWTRVLVIAAKKIFAGWKTKPDCAGYAWARAGNALDMDASIDFIEAQLRSGKPFMAGKIGTGDMEGIMRFIDITANEPFSLKWGKLLLGKRGPFWFDNWIRTALGVCAGVFPITDESLMEFLRIFMSYCGGFDAIPSWLPGERRVYDLLCPDAKIIKLESLAPFAHPRSWYGALEGRRVLVVHPYVRTIRAQYEKNVEFHKGQGPLPRFELIQYCPVNSIGGKCDRFTRWRDALDFMIADIEKIDFDVALLGCGVYGVPLSVHIKYMGRQAVYTGGATQIIFGIKGRRWDRLGIYNEHWMRAMPCDIPANMSQIEGGTFL